MPTRFPVWPYSHLDPAERMDGEGVPTVEWSNPMVTQVATIRVEHCVDGKTQHFLSNSFAYPASEPEKLVAARKAQAAEVLKRAYHRLTLGSCPDPAERMDGEGVPTDYSEPPLAQRRAALEAK